MLAESRNKVSKRERRGHSMKRHSMFAALIFIVCCIRVDAQDGMTKPGPGAQPAATGTAPNLPTLNEPPASPSAIPGTSANPPELAADYVIGREDVVQVTVWKEPSLSGNLVVRPDGMISIALLGDVPAAGLTPMALSNDLATRLKKYMTDASVNVSVVAVNSKKIYLIGEVMRPGPLPLAPDMTFLQAISSVGGLTPYANATHIYVLRGAGGKQQKIPFNYKKALKQGNQQGVKLLAGDTIVVP